MRKAVFEHRSQSDKVHKTRTDGSDDHRPGERRWLIPGHGLTTLCRADPPGIVTTCRMAMNPPDLRVLKRTAGPGQWAHHELIAPSSALSLTLPVPSAPVADLGRACAPGHRTFSSAVTGQFRSAFTKTSSSRCEQCPFARNPGASEHQLVVRETAARERREQCLNPPKSAPIGHRMHRASITRFSCFLTAFSPISRSSLKVLCKQEVAQARAP
jgi:hypothetical protein